MFEFNHRDSVDPVESLVNSAFFVLRVARVIAAVGAQEWKNVLIGDVENFLGFSMLEALSLILRDYRILKALIFCSSLVWAHFLARYKQFLWRFWKESSEKF